MRAAKASLLLLQISIHLSGCSSSSFSRRSSVSPRAFKLPSHRGRQQSDAHYDVLLDLRGGQQQQPDGAGDDGSGSSGSSTGSYHGNYVSSADGEPNAAVMSAVVQTTVPVQQQASPAPAPPVLASATSTNSKLSNLQERTGPAILMLGAIYLLLKFTGSNGLIGLVFLMQLAMYSESTSVVEDFGKKKGVSAGDDGIVSFALQKWWWFATAMMLTSGRKMLTEYTSVTMDQMNLITFGMSSLSLVGAVIQLAMISSTAAEDVYRSYLGKAACCHFSLLFLVGQSSFWIKTVKEYGLVWVLFPALLVVVNDTMAYIFGVLLGKHKLLPRLSPKKTVEGFVGAGISTMAIAAPLLKRMIGKDGVPNAGRHALTLALYVSLVSPFGGFLASAVKRAHGAKDFGALIPGHGGAVDRFDCQVVTAPFVYLYLNNCLSSSS
eukprot:CAMPEP_0201925770 /NCGR_PEP_ID=MMETSP0903-20130614/14891_1 /ASSEMBLY_ACC=CAM_ASM_000552 /TAXON_ID=420261 /ORGANISM="Thalassiosira antarctica, Strain CCMP982" /LENGTH=435 /DNA_ID=CAMNT_0048463483 /DNA_START=28 /DNA_END=1335 /DNA_ORIENTATION=+